jgi:hypothetical protein
MPKNLKRRYGRGDLHFVTFSCDRRIPLLRAIGARNVCVKAHGVSRPKENARPSMPRGLPQEVFGVFDGDGQVGAAEVAEDREIYADDFSVAVEEWSP